MNVLLQQIGLTESAVRSFMQAHATVAPGLTGKRLESVANRQNYVKRRAQGKVGCKRYGKT